MKPKEYRKGSVIVMVLLTTIIVIIFVNVLVSLNYHNMKFSTRHRDYIAAEQMAKAGLNEIVYKLTNDLGYGFSKESLNYTEGNCSYSVTFDNKDKHFCVNNLNNSGESPQLNFKGEKVTKETADLIITGKSRIDTPNPITYRIHAIAGRTFSLNNCLGTTKKISFDGNIEIGGIKSVLELENEIGGGVHSNDDGDASNPAINWLCNSGNIKMGKGSAISTCGKVSSNLKALSTIEDSPEKVLPNYSISSIVKRKSKLPKDANITYSSVTNSYYSSYLNLSKESYLKGDLTINGDLNLCDTSLYIDGNLTINGGIKGIGSVFITGDLNVNGGNVSFITNQSNSAAIFCDGKAKLSGLTAKGYLKALAAQYPEINKKYEVFEKDYKVLKDFLLSKEKTGSWDFTNFKSQFGEPPSWTGIEAIIKYTGNPFKDPSAKPFFPLEPIPPGYTQDEAAVICLWWATTKIACKTEQGQAQADFDFYSSIADIDGNKARSHETATIPALISQVKKSLGNNLENDVKAKRVLQGLNELFYFNRHNWDITIIDFFDNKLPMKNQSFDHMLWYVFPEPGGTREMEPKEYVKIFKDLTLNNDPLNDSWCGNSHLYGIFYTNEDIEISNYMKIYGTVISKGNVKLNDAALIYCEEYMKVSGATCPLRVISYKKVVEK